MSHIFYEDRIAKPAQHECRKMTQRNVRDGWNADVA
jgi:hypothetical protein